MSVFRPLLGVALAVATPAFADDDLHEHEPVLAATSFAPAALLSGPGFRVDPHVEIRGYMARFTLDTPYGPQHADSVEILAERIAELPALEALDRVTRSEAFTRAAADSAEQTARGIGQVLLHPVQTVIGIPAGVARYFGKRLRKLGDQAQSVSDRAATRLGTDGDKYPRDDGPMTDAHAAASVDPDHDDEPRTRRWHDRAGAEIGRELKRQVKYGQVRREIAERLGIDPYTSNPLIRERLERLAWVGSGGRFAARAAIGAIGGSAAVVLDRGGELNELVWKLDPESLRERNHERLRAYCRDELLMRQFVRRGSFTPTLQTALIDALDRLRPAAGGDALLELGMTTKSELEARFIVNALDLIARELGERAHGGTLRTIGAGLAYDSRDGGRILPLPVDYLAWTADVAEFLDRTEFRHATKTVLIAGAASMRSQRELTTRGWNIELHAPGAPTDAVAAIP